VTSDRSTPDGEASGRAPGDAVRSEDDDDSAGAVWTRADELAARAETTLSAIAKGANPTYEAFSLANAYTDETSARLRAGIRAFVRRLRGRP
jgi:hypothetical protein